jgi:hypothetical protein
MRGRGCLEARLHLRNIDSVGRRLYGGGAVEGEFGTFGPISPTVLPSSWEPAPTTFEGGQG